jgi:hypothetical protein
VGYKDGKPITCSLFQSKFKYFHCFIAIILSQYNNKPVSFVLTNNMNAGVDPDSETSCVSNIPQIMDKSNTMFLEYNESTIVYIHPLFHFFFFFPLPSSLIYPLSLSSLFHLKLLTISALLLNILFQCLRLKLDSL